MPNRFTVILLSFFVIGTSWSQDDNHADALKQFVELSKSAIDLYEIQLQGSLNEFRELRLDEAVSEYDGAKIVELLKNNDKRESGFQEVYRKTAVVFEQPESKGANDALDWLVNCAERENLVRAHKCSISLGMISLSKFETTALLDWANRAKEISSSLPKSHARYWQMQHQSNDLLLIALIFDRNVTEVSAIGRSYVESAKRSNIKLKTASLINNIAYLANKELGPNAAIEVLEPAREKMEVFSEEEQGVIYYSLGKNHMLARQFETALSHYRQFEKLDNRADLVPAAKANLAYIYANLGMVEESEKAIAIARDGLAGSLETNLGLHILKAQKLNAINSEHYSLALSLVDEIDRVDDLLDEREFSANRNRLSKNLQLTVERQKRETDRFAYEAQLSEQQAAASRRQLLLSLTALFFVLGMATWIFRGYRREQKLNAEINNKNAALVESNYQLEGAHDRLQSTFDELRVAHKQALAGQDAKEKFIGVIGHELRTPLNPIINLASVLEEKTENPRDRALLKAIKNAGKRLHIIVENMLAISSSDETTKIYIETVDVVENTTTIVREFHSEIQSKKTELKRSGENFKVNVLKEPDLTTEQFSNKVIYRSIVRNLFDNALKFTRNGEVIIELRKRMEGPGFVFVIRDSGVGMEPKKINELIEPFQQAEMDLGRAYEGAGLGLAVVRKYCEQLGAKLMIDSKVNMGTQITIDFPEPSYVAKTGQLLKVA